MLIENSSSYKSIDEPFVRRSFEEVGEKAETSECIDQKLILYLLLCDEFIIENLLDLEI